MGGTVVAISCWDNDDKKAYTYQNKLGIDVDKLASIKDRFGTINKKKALDMGLELLDGDEWISQDVDILLPCALETK